MANKPGTRLRGYGVAHQRLRKAWKLKVERGGVHCARCGKAIHPNEAWDLGHDDQDRKRWSGPEHQKCNRGAPRRGKGKLTEQGQRFSRIW